MIINNNKKKLPIIIIISIIIISITLFLIFKNKYTLVLDGNTNITLYQGDTYIEPGYHLYINKEDKKELVIVNNNINTSNLGNYEITYKYKNKTLKRNITITTKPVGATYIYLLGNETIYLKLNEEYKEPGYKVIDTNDNSLLDKVKVTNNIDTTKAGTYEVIYTVTNSSNITTSKKRTIIVTSSNISLTLDNTNYTNQPININYKISDNYFNYLILPDKTKVNNKNGKYKITNNGTYTFISYDKLGNKTKSTIEVKNIDTTPPNASCTGTYTSTKSIININANDKSGINHYLIEGNIYKENNITINKSLEKPNITIIDNAGNQTTISCTLDKKNDHPLEIHFINVGREDAIFIRSNETTIFIDGGTYSNTRKNLLVGYLNSLGVTKINALIGSHLHLNHMQVQNVFLENFTVDKIYYPQDIRTCAGTYCTNGAQKYIVDAIKKYNKDVTIMNVGDHIVLGDLTIDNYGPINIQSYKEGYTYPENNNSLNFILTYENTRFMFTGDCIQSSNILKKFTTTNFKVNLLKYPHHGQASIGKEFTYAMSPEYVIVTNNEISSLQSRSEYTYFQNIGSKIYYSGRDNNILALSDGEKVTIKTNVNANDYKR